MFFMKKLILTKKSADNKKHAQLITQHAKINEPVHEISNNVVCATSKVTDQPAHTRSLIRAFACRLSII